MEQLIETHHRVLQQYQTQKKRYLYNSINWGNRLVAITGQRGVGKTTLLIQRIKESKSSDDYLYVSADSLFIYKLSLYEIALNLKTKGVKYFFIDEVHKYHNWSSEIKHIYDTIPELNIVFTGSSILDIMKGYADLSRRAVHYTLQGMSFREYLYFETGTAYDIYDIATLVKNGFKEEVESPLYHFNRYLNKGYYPFYKEPDFELRLLSVVNTILEVDLIQYLDLRPSTTAKLKKLLQIISESVPFKPNLTKIAELTGISRSLLLDYIKYLERAGLISLLNTSTKGIQALGKPEKIYLNNTNLNYALGGQLNTNLGNVRETFFMSQLAMQTEVTIPEKGDFLVSNYCFEVGGRSKTKKQIQGVENAFVVKDDIEFSQGNIIPLWHFGFLY